MFGEPIRGDRARLHPQRTVDPLVAATLFLLIIGIGGVILWRHFRQPPAMPAVAVQPRPAPPAAPGDASEQREAESLASSGAGTDASVHIRLGTLSARPEWETWLAATGDLIESCAVIIADVSEDELPYKRLAALRAGPAFEVVERNGGVFQSPSSRHRYDVATEVLNSIDVDRLAAAWHALHPLIAAAYKTFARPHVPLDQAAARALRRIEHAPALAGDPLLEQTGHYWRYADPKLESQGQIEKLLFRIGPDNERLLQAKASAIRAALALP